MPYSYGPYELLADGGVGAPSVYSSPTTPTFSAAKGSLCISAGGSAYMNTDGATTWTVLQAGSGAVTNVTATAPISSSGGAVPNIAISPSPTFAGTVIAAALTALGPVSPGVSGSTGTAVIYSGSGVPAFSATQGSLYLSSNGSLYGNVNGSTTWAAVSTGGTVTSVGATAPLAASGGNAPLISISNSPTFTGTITSAGVTTLGPVSPGLAGIIGTASIYGGSGIPSFSAAKGSIFLSSSGTTYVNTSGSTTWTGLAAGGSVTGVTASSPLTSSGGTAPNIAIQSPLPIANGGTGSTGPSLVHGSGINITGTWPNQTVSVTGSVNGWLNVKDYGALGNPTNDAAAILAAFSAAQAIVTGGSRACVFFPPGYYIYNSATPISLIPGISVLAANVQVIFGALTTTAISFAAGNYNNDYFLFPGISGPGYTGATIGLLVNPSANLITATIPDINAFHYGIRSVCYAVNDQIFDNTFNFTIIGNCFYAIALESLANGFTVQQGHIFNGNFIDTNYGAAIRFFAPSGQAPPNNCHAFNINAIDGGAALSIASAGIVFDTGGFSGPNIFNHQGFFSGFTPAAGGFVSLINGGSINGAGMTFNLANGGGSYSDYFFPNSLATNNVTSFPKYATGTVTARTAANQRASYNGGAAIVASAYTVVLPATNYTAGVSVAFYAYSPYVGKGSNAIPSTYQITGVTGLTAGVVMCWGVALTANANEVAIMIWPSASMAGVTITGVLTCGV